MKGFVVAGTWLMLIPGVLEVGLSLPWLIPLKLFQQHQTVGLC